MVAVLLLAATLPNLDFSPKNLTLWEGTGFHPAPGRVSSAEATGGVALLHRTIRLPADAAVLRFRAAVVRKGPAREEANLDIVLEASGRAFLPKLVLNCGKWEPAPKIRPADEKGELREYIWQVDGHAGRRVRIALVDNDARPGNHVICTGFELMSRDELNIQHFADDMHGVHVRGEVPRARRLDSKHFVAFSNADRAFAESRLANCELFYASYFPHFRRRGFDVREPNEKLMVAIFGTQQGFDTYLGINLGPSVTGMYHTPTNRLVVYDYGTNPAFLSTKKGADDFAKKGVSDLDRRGKGATVDRLLHERRADVNVSTMMHEVAHQLAFNTGLLNRHGDTPGWLVEGMAVYCESTRGGAWQGIGESNPTRVATLVRKRYRLRQLVENDDWLRKAPLVEDVVSGYSASWLLFRLLIEERPKNLKAYLETIHARKTPDHRLADFGAAFGDWKKIEKRYDDYVEEVIRRESK